MAKQKSMAQRVRGMIDRGHTNREIINKLGVKPQMVYNLRYQINKARGLGSIGKPTPKPAEGIGAPPKRVRRVRAGTGINIHEPLIMVAPTKREPFAITMIEPEPTLWERIKRFFTGA